MTTYEFNGLTEDLLFKYIFSKEKIVADFLNSVFDYLGLLKVEVVSALPQSMIQSGKKGKKNFYGDLVLTLGNGDIVSLECYNHFGLEEFYKSFSYICRLYSNQFETNDKYVYANNVISLNVVKGNFLNTDKSLVKYFVLKESVTNDMLIFKPLSVIVIYLDLVEYDRYNETEERFIKWMRLIKETNLEKIRCLVKGDRIMEETLKYLERYFNDPKVQAIYKRDTIAKWKKEAKELGREEGKEIGKEIGKEEEKINIAKRLLMMNMSIVKIHEITGLSEAQIEELDGEC